jgi:hypothetical protein
MVDGNDPVIELKANRKRTYRTDYVSSYPQHRYVLNVMQALATHAALVTERNGQLVITLAQETGNSHLFAAELEE